MRNKQYGVCLFTQWNLKTKQLEEKCSMGENKKSVFQVADSVEMACKSKRNYKTEQSCNECITCVLKIKMVPR